MGTNFTPGPWVYENGLGIKACGNPLKIAGRTKVAIANRALIQSAPDLYAEAVAALDCLIDQCGLAEDCELIVGLRAAIANAEGRAFN